MFAAEGAPDSVEGLSDGSRTRRGWRRHRFLCRRHCATRRTPNASVLLFGLLFDAQSTVLLFCIETEISADGGTGKRVLQSRIKSTPLLSYECKSSPSVEFLHHFSPPKPAKFWAVFWQKCAIVAHLLKVIDNASRLELMMTTGPKNVDPSIL